jgi:signal transduction histidine kinase
VAAARAAIGRQNRHGAVVKLVAPAPAAVAASPGEVALVLDNLLGNALRHARAVVQVGVLPAGRTVRLVVEDDGPGIPAADRDRVFDRFTRLDPDVESRAGGGAGLGLALVAALVTGRGGTVAASGAAGGGARLEVRWPAARP